MWEPTDIMSRIHSSISRDVRNGGALGMLRRVETPEEREYARFLVDLEDRRRRVSDLRTELESLRVAIGRFEAEYYARVGTLFVELDRLRLAIDEYEYRIKQLRSKSNIDPLTVEEDTKSRFADARENVRAENEEARRFEQEFHRNQASPKLDPSAEAQVKRLYRELARRFHPDLARTSDERLMRERVMQRVNAAFHARDIVMLQSIAAETEVVDVEFESRSIGEKLVWAIREIARLDELGGALQHELDEIRLTDSYSLWYREESGERVIERLELDLRSEIARREIVLNELTFQYSEIVEAARDDQVRDRQYPAIVGKPGSTLPAGLLRRGVERLSSLEDATDVRRPSHSVPFPRELWRRDFREFDCGSWICDDTIYVHLLGDSVLALNAATGDERWRFQTTDEYVWGVSENSEIVLVWEEESCSALERTNGRVCWCFEVESALWASAAADDVLYIGGSDGNVYALTLETGAEKWRFEIGRFIDCSPELVDSVLYVGSGGAVDALDASSGGALWHYSLQNAESIDGCEAPSPLAIDGDTVFFGATDGRIYALDAVTGRNKWCFASDGRYRNQPLVANGSLYVGSRDGSVYALDSDDGSEQWRCSVGGWVVDVPLLRDGMVLVSTVNHSFHAIDSQTGEERWHINSNDFVRAAPTVTDDAVYLGDERGNLCHLNISDGAIIWSYPTGSRGPKESTFSFDGGLFCVVNTEGIVVLDVRLP